MERISQIASELRMSDRGRVMSVHVDTPSKCGTPAPPSFCPGWGGGGEAVGYGLPHPLVPQSAHRHPQPGRDPVNHGGGALADLLRNVLPCLLSWPGYAYTASPFGDHFLLTEKARLGLGPRQNFCAPLSSGLASSTATAIVCPSLPAWERSDCKDQERLLSLGAPSPARSTCSLKVNCRVDRFWLAESQNPNSRLTRSGNCGSGLTTPDPCDQLRRLYI
ncbi:uncharacterized protein LOC125098128 [Lutra lutra]|uniref:uncharacterized protein LOC125098128 n=1 Tax=Lutra lutra TaxID=9657 RepID=UPI001FD483B4|nr:uncharacterized protein LOC125098128 [Lutra lutra]